MSRKESEPSETKLWRVVLEESGRDGGQVRRVWSKEMRRGDCQHVRGDEIVHVRLTLQPASIQESTSRHRPVLRDVSENLVLSVWHLDLVRGPWQLGHPGISWGASFLPKFSGVSGKSVWEGVSKASGN